MKTVRSHTAMKSWEMQFKQQFLMIVGQVDEILMHSLSSGMTFSGSQSANRETSILSAPQGKSDENALSDNLARSIKEAMSDQSLKLEITMVNEKGDRKTYNVENNGRITTPMNY
jgi:hypothetical protein